VDRKKKREKNIRKKQKQTEERAGQAAPECFWLLRRHLRGTEATDDKREQMAKRDEIEPVFTTSALLSFF
jgi:hypothetical protein